MLAGSIVDLPLDGLGLFQHVPPVRAPQQLPHIHTHGAGQPIHLNFHIVGGIANVPRRPADGFPPRE